MDSGLSRARIAVYAALGVVVLLLGLDAFGGGIPTNESEDQGQLLAEGPVLSSPAGGGAAGDVVVHVAGAVAEPGVYKLAAGSRVTDAIERAGGPSSDALTDGINLAARLADGQQVVLPGKEAASASGGGSSAAGATDAPISLGSATAADLEEIDGIGPVTAATILEFRDQNGGVGSIQELDQISGIGPVTIEALSARLQP